MKRFIANLLAKIIISANDELKYDLFKSLLKGHNNTQYLAFRNKYSISKSFRFNGNSILFYGEGEIICGENSYIGSFSTVQSADGCKVMIGKNCSISHNVRIYTSSNIADQPMNTDKKRKKSKGDVIIQDGVWIGANVFIKEGVTIGQNAIVGANSVVTKDLISDGIYGGVPAKYIRNKINNENETN